MKDDTLMNIRPTIDQEREGRLESLGWIVTKIVHEVRNPLGSIELITSLLRKELNDDADKKRLIDHVICSVKNIDTILSNLLHFTRTPKPNLKMNNAEIMLQKCLEVVSYNILKNNIKVIQKIDPDIWINCDEILIRQVFVNMFVNSLQAMKAGGVLTIETIKRFPDMDVDIHITDTGCGIPAELSERIFDPFFTTSEKGTGLGLTIVHNILKVHGGNIKVQSKEGEGTKFTIKFPAVKQSAEDEL
ncbi:MAG: hypothetical protein HZA08_03190 [Nitrospirae bacterium]|nr:hypothetical protein [Nitrospirota bacterium]